MTTTATRPIAAGLIATGASTSTFTEQNFKTIQASGTTTSGVGSATIQIQGSLDGSSWDTFGTITLTLGTVSTSDSFASNDRYPMIRANVSALSGTGASVNVNMGF